jgi:hypothetical protein
MLRDNLISLISSAEHRSWFPFYPCSKRAFMVEPSLQCGGAPPSQMRPSRGLVVQLLRLDWMVPHRGLPHGLCGCASLLCGSVIVCGSLSGSYEGVQGPLLLCYCLTTAANSVAGYLIAGRAPRVFHVFFRCAAVFQLCLVYYALRFSPLWLRTWPAATSAADTAVAAMLPFNIAAFVFAGFVHLPLLAALAVLFGAFALALLAVYPAQLESGHH